MKTKTDKVKDHLLQYGTITTWQAIQQYKATRLSDIILRLRRRGYNIVTIMKETDAGERYGVYVLSREGDRDE